MKAEVSEKSKLKAVVAATIGNSLEWFEIVIYGFFAPVIATQFFPAADPAVSLLITLGTFGGSFFIRPLGAVVIGSYADRVGRKSALLLTIMLMMLGSTMIALCPNYATIGVAAPIIIILARLVQGFSAGGEFASATAFLAEQSPSRRAFYSSWQFASQGLTMLLAAAFGYGLNVLLSDQELAAWGWRIPFAFGLLIGPVALYIRRNIDDSPEFKHAKTDNSPLADALKGQKEAMLIGLGTVILATVSMYLLLYMPSFALTTLELSGTSAYVTHLAVGAVLVVLTPLSGMLADARGRVAVALPAAAVLTLVALPLFLVLVEWPSTLLLLIVELAITVPLAFYLGAVPALLTELFPVNVRSTSMSLSYNLAVMTFGGLAPFIVTWAIVEFSLETAPGLYLAAAALISTITLLIARRRGVM